jgi:prepilin signal peptidase PulO-like enzyme (type II secretory pathway)
MLYLFLAVTIVCGFLLITGFIWMLASSGVINRRNSDQLGAQLMSESPEEEDEQLEIGRAVAFRGKASQVSVQSSYSFSEIKSSLASGQWRQVLPAILTAGGLVGFLLFGTAALFLALEDKFVGALMLLLVMISITRALFNFMRS